MKHGICKNCGDEAGNGQEFCCEACSLDYRFGQLARIDTANVAKPHEGIVTVCGTVYITRADLGVTGQHIFDLERIAGSLRNCADQSRWQSALRALVAGKPAYWCEYEGYANQALLGFAQAVNYDGLEKALEQYAKNDLHGRSRDFLLSALIPVTYTGYVELGGAYNRPMLQAAE